MTFTFTNYAGIEPQASPYQDMIGKILGGYTGMTNARYLPREKEADIFHKQIAPLAMLASSPYFSSLHPTQQQQIAGYISQMLGKQGLGSTQGTAGGGGGQMPQGQQGMSDTMPQQGGQANYGTDGQSLAPRNPAEHFTGKFTQSPYDPGTPHTTGSGETVYTPTGANVQKGLDVLTQTKGLNNLFNKYIKLAPQLSKGGPIKQDLSVIGSNIEKLGFPGSKQISDLLGGSKLANQSADLQALKNEMVPALRALDFKDNEIESLLTIHPGETPKNVEDRLKRTLPVIENRIKLIKKNLKQGINVNERNEERQNTMPKDVSKNISKIMKNEQAKGAPPGSVALYRNGELYYIPADKVNEATAEGFTWGK